MENEDYFTNLTIDTKSLHKSINNGDLDGVKTIVEKYPDEKYFKIKKKSETAAAVALKAEKFEIYDFLLSKGAYRDETLKNIMDFFKTKYMQKIVSKRGISHKAQLDEKMSVISDKIRYIHDRFTKTCVPKHLLTFFNASKFHFTHESDSFMQILPMLVELNEIRDFNVVMKVAATSESFTIVADPQSSSVHQMIPKKSSATRGTTCYDNDTIYIGALKSFNDLEKHEVIGTLAHETTHYAMKLVYNNSRKPYLKNDTESKKKFEEISKECEKNKEKEPIIATVYGYSENKRHVELIVRVPHLLAYYTNDNQKLENCKKDFQDLFKFFEEKTLPDFKLELSKLEAKQKANGACGMMKSLTKTSMVQRPLNLKTIKKFKFTAQTAQN